ncbi:MAG: PadR family transcriptional regulator [Aggregatilineales bacterium]
MNFRGSLPLMVLYVLSKGSNHGYRIAQHIESESDGFFNVKAGTLYPTLHSLEKQGVIDSYKDVENGREVRYYRLTSDGKKQLDTSLTEWDGHVSAVNRVLRSLK